MRVTFGILESSSDSLLIGMPQLTEWGMKLYKNSAGQPMIGLEGPGVDAPLQGSPN